MERQRPGCCYCLQVRQAASTIKSYYDRVLSPSGITVRQYSLLLNIAKLGVCSARELADLTELDRSTLARSLKPLLRYGYIIDNKERNARNSSLGLTLKGEETLQHASKLWNQAQNNVEDKFGKDGIQQLLSVMDLLNSL